MCVFFFCCSIRTFAQPKADFTVNTTRGCGALIAYFTDASTGNPNKWLWDFGNGQTSNKQNPDAFYSAPGIYSVTLTVMSNAGTDKITRNDYIIIEPGPIAQFSLASGSGCIPYAINFLDYSTEASAAITTWFWDFGDGANSTQQNPTHTYTTEGYYSVQLKIRDAKGCIDSLLLTDTVKVGTKPIPDFITTQFNVCASTGVSFKNQTKGNYTSFYWNFGDGDTSSKTSPVHFFEDSGFMNVKLIAYDYGCKDSVEKKNYVYIKPPIVKIRYTYNCDSPYRRNFQAKIIAAKSYVWDFGDGTTDNISSQPSHTYKTPGTYIVKLSATGDSCNYQDTATINIIDEHPTYVFSNKSITCKYDTVEFSAGNFNAAFVNSIAWDYGDGVISSFKKSSLSEHIYTTSGTWYPKIIIKDILGCYDTIQNNTNIKVYGPSASFSVDTIVCTNYNVHFTDLSTNDANSLIKTWIWNYGDGIIDSLQAEPFEHSYIQMGTYDLKLKVVDANGCYDTLIKKNALTTIPTPEADISIIDTVSCFLSTVSFFDQSQGQQLGRQWFFGDGDTSSQSYIQHIYQQPGTYNVQLVIGKSQGCTDTIKSFVRVVPLPIVYAGADTTVCYAQTLTMQPKGALNYLWQADTTLSCNACNNPIAKPLSATKYFVTGTDKDGCSASDSITVEVKPVINLSLYKTLDTLCLGEATQLIALGAEIYNWSPPTALSSTNVANPVAKPNTTTDYRVIGIDNKNCFTDTAYVTVKVVPKPQFNIIDTSVVIAAGSLFTIKTTSSADVIKWQWIPPRDLSCTSCSQPKAKGDKITEYTGTVYNSYGCNASDKIKITALCNDKLIFVPNTFSPNGDGMNERFYPRGKGLYVIKSMRIFNRLGQAVFQKLNFAADVESEGWDGTNYGKKLPSDVYIYYVEIMCNNGVVITLKGDVTLLL